MKSLLAIILFSALSIASYAQKKENKQPERFVDKLFWGGTIGIMIGDVTRIDVQPVAGIWVIPQWSVGVGGRYGYYSQKSRQLFSSDTKVYRSHIWGASAFTQILPIRDLSESTPIKLKGGIIFHGEYEGLYIDQKMIDPFNSTQTGRVWQDVLLAGVGYRQKLGERAALNIIFLWTLSGEARTTYAQNPILRVNVTF